MVEIRVDRQEDVVSGGALKSACTTLLARIGAGVEITGPNGVTPFPRKVGMTVGVLGAIERAKKRVGEPKREFHYYCSRTDRYFATAKQCQSACAKAKVKQSKEDERLREEFKNRLAAEPVGKAAPECARELSRITAKYKVTRTYEVKIYRVVMVWKPSVSAADKRIVTAWNEARLEHEEAHVEQITTLAKRLLPEEMNYTAEGTTEFEVENNLQEQILEDEGRLRGLFYERIQAKGAAFDEGRGAAVPSICGAR